VLPEHRGAGIGSALLDAVDAEFARLGLDDQVIGVPGNVDAFVCTNGGGSDQRGSTCPGSPVATAVPRKAGYPGGARLADMGDPPEPSPEQPLGDRPTPAASPRQFVKWGVLLVITGVSLYLLLPSLLSVLSSWPSLEHLDWPFAVLVLVSEVASSICLWELDRIALGSKGWFAVACGQLAGNALGRIIPGSATPLFTVVMLRKAGIDGGVAAAGLTASTGLQIATALALPVLAVPAILGGAPVNRGLAMAAYLGVAVLGPEALAATLLYRLISYWLPIPVGGVAYLLFRRRYGKRTSVDRQRDGA